MGSAIGIVFTGANGCPIVIEVVVSIGRFCCGSTRAISGVITAGGA